MKTKKTWKYKSHHSPEAKQKIREASTRLWKDEIFRRKASHTCSEKNKKLHSKRMMGRLSSKSIAKHHIYLRQNDSKCLTLTYAKHGLLHAKAYDYIYYKYGKKGIDNFISWFDECYGLYEKK